MAGIVYLRTNRFEVKLEGITFKTKDFESLCTLDFLFPKGKIWARPPVVGIDVMIHPRDPNIVLVFLCIGVGCLIIRFHLGDILPEPIFKFLTDERIRFVAFGIPEKKDLFPFGELGMTKNKVDIGYLAANTLDDPKYKNSELADLARKILRVKNMIGLTDASSFERHEQVKCAICQLFITTAIGMTLLNKDNRKKSEKLEDSPKKISFLKNLNSLPLFTEGWFKFRRSDKQSDSSPSDSDGRSPNSDVHYWLMSGYGFREGEIDPVALQKPANDHFYSKDDSPDDDVVPIKGSWGGSGDVFNLLTSVSTDNPTKEEVCAPKKPLKGILKCPSSRFEGSNPATSSSNSSSSGCGDSRHALKRANSKGYNVTFK